MPHAQQTTSTGQADARYNPRNHGIHAETQTMFDETAADLADLELNSMASVQPRRPHRTFSPFTPSSTTNGASAACASSKPISGRPKLTDLNTNAEIERATSGDAFATTAPAFERLQTHRQFLRERNYHRALKQLAALQVASRLMPRQPQRNTRNRQNQPRNPNSPQPVPRNLAPLSPNPPHPPPAAVQPQTNRSQTWQGHHFPTVDEAIDAAFLAISKEAATGRRDSPRTRCQPRESYTNFTASAHLPPPAAAYLSLDSPNSKSMRSKKVVFFFPAFSSQEATAPLGILAVSTPLLRAGYQVTLIDSTITPNFQKRVLEELKDALCLAVSLVTGPMIKRDRANRPRRQAALSAANRSSWAAGIPRSFRTRRWPPNIIDIVVKGQGEEAFLEIVQRIEAGESMQGIAGRGLQRRRPHRIQCAARPQAYP